MRLLSHAFAVAAVVVNAGCASPQSTGGAFVEVQEAHARLVAAYNACNEMAFTAAYAETFTLTTSNTRSAITTPEGLRAYLSAGCRQSPSPQVAVLSQALRGGGDNAIATGQYMFRVSSAGKLNDVRQNYTLVLQRATEGWRLSAHHVSVAP